MAFETGTETLICPDCNAEHKAKWYRLPVRDEATADCAVCGTNMVRGRRLRDYIGIELMKKT